MIRSLSGSSGTVWAVVFDGAGMLASGGWDEKVRLWEAKNGALIKSLSGHSSWIWSLAFDGNGLLASGASDKTIKLWSQ
jgi:WD40 repeat protein